MDISCVGRGTRWQEISLSCIRVGSKQIGGESGKLPEYQLWCRYLLISCCFVFLNAMVSGDINDNRMLFAFVGLLAAANQFRDEKPIKMIKSVTDQSQSVNDLWGV